ncbi:MAG: radical SAM protein, partial [Bacteroidota bacterium]|nr:radical SAM protein [Bacteroidota bacterium]
MNYMRHNWTREEILEIYNKPLMELLYEAATVHREFHDPNTVQVSTLLSIKTGGCPEDCGYCPQAARYHTDIEGNDLMRVSHVKAQALRAKAAGSSRVCMGAAWRNVKDGEEFDQVLEMVRTINKLDMEVCCTLGMITENQAQRLAEAGLYAYNHNLDTSEDYYKDVISTRA